MWNDFLFTNMMHNAITGTREVLRDAFSDIPLSKCPQCSNFLLPDSKDYWDANLDEFPQEQRKKGTAFQVDRILPLPLQIRDTLNDMHFNESADVQEKAKSEVDNQNCLFRIYLGEIDTREPGFNCYDSLRDFQMRLDMIEDLKLDRIALATGIAIALAVNHWKAQVDGIDVKFVLGSTAATHFEKQGRPYTVDKRSDVQPSPSELHPLQFTQTPTQFWVLDFDKAAPFNITADDVDTQLANAFVNNDLCYPRLDVNDELWAEFSRIYLMASQRLFEKQQEKSAVIMNLPKRVLAKVAETIKKNNDWDAEK